MTDDLILLRRLGAELDAPNGLPATLRARVMAELLSEDPPPRQPARRWLMPAIAAAAAAVAAGGVLAVGAPPASRSPDAMTTTGTATAQRVDTSVFRSGDADYMIFASPEDLAKANGVTTVFTGEVRSFAQGRTIAGPGIDEKRVVMTVALSETLKGPRDSGFAYVELPQPTCAGDVPCATVADFIRAIPAGTKVLVFGETAPEIAPTGGRLVDNNAGRPAGAHLIQPNPQGLLFDSATTTGTTVVSAFEKIEKMPEAWHTDPASGIDGLRTRLRQAGIGN
jgi:hypothetical protein